MKRHMDTISEAIEQRHLLRVEYRTAPGYRRVEPHACGWSRHDDALAQVYQVSGPSLSGASEGWKMLRLDRVLSLEMLDEQFDGPRDEYVRGGSQIPRIRVQL